MTHRQPFNLFIASCTGDGGIYRYQIGAGKARQKGFCPMDRPMYMVSTEDTLYVLLRESFADGCSGLITLDTATFRPGCMPSSTLGKVACHLCLDNGFVYATNYTSGSVVRMEDLCVQRLGSSVHPQRQTSSHPHYITPTPDGKYLLLTDLGTDQICIYNKDLSIRSQVDMFPGSGPRHLAFSPDGAFVFCANELGNTLSVLAYRDGTLQHLSDHPTVPKDFLGETTAGAIRCTGDRIYVSNRGHDSVAEFLFADGKPELLRYLPAYGQCPRDIWIHDGLLMVANQLSDYVSIIDLATGALLESIQIPTPLCVIAK